MNDLQQAAFELRFSELKGLRSRESSLAGTLLAACSTHDPDEDVQVAVVRYLIGCGVSVHETDKNGVTPLHRTVRFRNLAAAKELIAHGANVNAVDKRSHSTPLHRAVTDTGAPSTAGKTHVAVEIVKLLLASGADTAIRNKNEKTPIEYVRDRKMKELFETGKSS
ncbi:Ankyrin repeat protein [Thalassoglobus neptunius]|uniref:Ankyrin repeat protein n=1 Tax=Thalassoglobus neptunius TaxID=1938619 RepID=A0A5C5VQD1_9PLAN|nr:ankyrin repeat domain-containing protein [Thalassoglobus neptunius]TWT39792.1 Ankyrin repeat protein [Thalassoglobus neptunius]